MSTEPDSPSPLTPSDGQLASPSFALLQGPAPPFGMDGWPECSYAAAQIDLESINAKCTDLAGARTFARFYALAKQVDRDWVLAARSMRDLDFSGNHGRIAKPFPDIAMLHEVAPHVVSVKIDIPFGAARRLSECPRLFPQLAREFPYLTRLTIDETNAALWTHEAMQGTVEAFAADGIPELHFVNARRATVTVCSEFVLNAHTCILVDDANARYIGFLDQRNFERRVSGRFVDAVSFMFKPLFWSTITSLTLGDAMPETELPILFSCFPKGLKQLSIWFGGVRTLHRRETELLRYRDAGRGCCAHLERLTLTTSWPFKGQNRASHPWPVPVEMHVVRSFLKHLSDGEPHVDIEAEGAIELV